MTTIKDGESIPGYFRIEVNLLGYYNNIVGKACKLWRIEQGYTQRQIASELNYSQPTISKFECGQDDNLNILLWYIKMGFDPNKYIFERGAL